MSENDINWDEREFRQQQVQDIMELASEVTEEDLQELAEIMLKRLQTGYEVEQTRQNMDSVWAICKFANGEVDITPPEEHEDLEV